MFAPISVQIGFDHGIDGARFWADLGCLFCVCSAPLMLFLLVLALVVQETMGLYGSSGECAL